ITRRSGARYCSRYSATGASRSIDPSSAATSTATATSGFVSDASANSESARAQPARCDSRIPSAPTTAAATAGASPPATHAALFIFGWVLQGASGGSSATTTTPPTTHHNPATSKGTTPPGGTGTVPAKHAKAQWKQIPLTVLNGFGGANAASTAQTQLRAAG